MEAKCGRETRNSLDVSLSLEQELGEKTKEHLEELMVDWTHYRAISNIDPFLCILMLYVRFLFTSKMNAIRG